MDNQGEIPHQPEQPKDSQSQASEQAQAHADALASLQRLDAIAQKLDEFNATTRSSQAEIIARQNRPSEGQEVPETIDVKQELQNIQRSIGQELDPTKIASEARFVVSLGKKWQQDAIGLAKHQGNEDVVNLLKNAHLDMLIKSLEQAQRDGKTEQVRSDVAKLAETLGSLAKQPDLREFGYFEVPRSFEDLMEYIAAAEDPKFSPGGEFPLFEKRMILDKDGNPILKPQGERGEPKPIYEVITNKHNFIRWVMEREMYFIGQNPFVNINLFQDVSVPSVNPITMGYIVNNDRFWISEKWEAKDVFIELSQEQYNEAKAQGEYVIQTPDGKYALREIDYVQVKSAPDNNLRDAVILNMFLTDTEHNMDVMYFVDGMKNEKPLKEAMEKICNSNFETRFFPLMMHDPSVSEYHNPKGVNGERRGEVVDLLAQDLDLKYQGKLGKAQQRALAMYYHLAEANAVANGMRVEGQNPFYKILEGIDVQGNLVGRSEIFYKSLVRQTIEANLADEVAGVKDLLEVLNTLSNPQNSNGKRYDWEKIDLVDLLFLNRVDLQKVLNPLNLSIDDIDRARTKLIEKYNADPKMSQEEKAKRITQLNTVAQGNSKQQFLDSFDKSRKLSFKQAMGKDRYDAFLNKSGYEGIDYFGIKFFASAYEPGGSTQDANIYRHIKYNDAARKKVKQAIADVLVHTEKLDAFEAKYASERSFRRTYFMGISARNDVDSIGHDAGSKTGNTLYYRIRQANRATNFYGMEENIFGIRRLSADMFEAINGKLVDESGYKRSLYQMVMGTEETMDEKGDPVEVRYNLDKDIGQFELPGNSMKQYFADHLANALSLWDLISGPHGVDIIGKFQHQDSLGRWVFDHKAFKEFMDGVRKQMTYAYDNQGILYKKLTAGWTKETYVEIDEETGEPVPKQRVVFGVRELKDLMFADRVQQMGMYERPDLGKPIPRGTEKDKMARNVLAYLIAAQLKSHRREGREYWNAQAIEQVAEAFRKYGIGILEMANEEAFFLRGFFTPNELRVILGTAEIFLWAIASREYGEDAFSGFLAGLFESFSIIMKEVGAGITLK